MTEATMDKGQLRKEAFQDLLEHILNAARDGRPAEEVVEEIWPRFEGAVASVAKAIVSEAAEQEAAGVRRWREERHSQE